MQNEMGAASVRNKIVLRVRKPHKWY